MLDGTAILKSVALGLLIGVALQVPAPAGTGVPERLLGLLVCGVVGLVVGVATEWLTSLLPIRFARTAVYFAVNNVIAVVIAAVVTVLLGGLATVVILVVVIVCVANLGDYLVYRRAQRRLREVQARLADGQ